jgi:eukaryotic-like serine/threonine-protein kinase
MSGAYMPFAPGARIGAFEILAPLGSGGMGEVYRARDTRLGREVAIKTLPEMFTADAGRVARFEREAQILAALNHPNIAAIHGVDAAGGTPVLVLELVDGESLAARLQRGRLPVAEALAIARQMVDALEAAHDRGIVHRDLKPANVMVTADDRVKVLDFGLAKFEAGVAGEAGGLTQSPTITFAATQAGVILGTAAYMSPEQAKGRAADKRSDVWAFGCVLYEMLTGRRAFDGEDVSDTIAAILRGAPDWSAVPPEVPPHVRQVLEHCLTKDRTARIPDISVVRFALDHPTVPVAPSTHFGSPQARLGIALAAAAVMGAAVGIVIGARYLARQETGARFRFTIAPPPNATFIAGNGGNVEPALAPDGKSVAFTARDAGGNILLWVRALDELSAQPLAGTEGATYPFWSPDSRFIGYSTPGRLMKVAARGGPSQTVCTFRNAALIGRGAAWSTDGVIVFNNGPNVPLYRVQASGGDPSPIGAAPDNGIYFSFPSFLPDGRTVLAFGFALGPDTRTARGVYLVPLGGGTPTRLLDSDSSAIFAPEGYLLFLRQGSVLAQRFDPAKLALIGEPVPVAENVDTTFNIPGFLGFSVSTTGLLAYGMAGSAGGLLRLTWVDRGGKALGTVGPDANYRGIDLSPDDRRVAVHRHDTDTGDVWIIDVADGRTSRFTFDPSRENVSPVWSPDGRFVAFGTRMDGTWTMFRKLSNNSADAESLLESNSGLLPESWSPDGKAIVYVTSGAQSSSHLGILPLAIPRTPRPLGNASSVEVYGQISPDGRWLAYASTETARSEIYVRSLHGKGGKWTISTAGGEFPRWRSDGRELFYLVPSAGTIMHVDVSSNGDTFEAGRPGDLFESGFISFRHGAGPYHAYAVSRDGQRFLIPRPPGGATSQSAAIVVNWAATLPK